MLTGRLAMALLVLFLALTMTNCSGGNGNPVTAPVLSTERNASDFDATSMIFPASGNEHNYLGVDLATVVQVGDIPASITVNDEQKKITALVSLEIEDMTNPNYTKQTASLAWLNEVDAGDAPEVLERITFGTIGGQLLEYKCPHVTAWLDDTSSTVEVAVSFQWQYFFSGCWTEWAPGVWFMQWPVSAFSEGTPAAIPDAIGE